MEVMHLTVNRTTYSDVAKRLIRQLDFADNSYWQQIITGKKFDTVRVVCQSAPAQFVDFKFTGYGRNVERSKLTGRMESRLRVFLSERIE